MAKIDYLHPASEHFPEFTETVEVRVWGMSGSSGMPFYVGGGINFDATDTLWAEIIYSVEGAHIFYTRNFLHHTFDDGEVEEQEERLKEVLKEGEGTFGYTGIMPETGIHLTLEKFSYTDFDDQPQESTNCTLHIFTDTGVVFGRESPPGMRTVEINLRDIEPEDGERFFRDLIHEIAAVKQGKHPDPASFPAGSSEWYFTHQLNTAAYNKLSEEYKEKYFENNPLLAQAFEDWLNRLPAGAGVLDAGCGHGDPVIGRLLESGFNVTGSDFSPAMLRRAREQYPQASYIQAAATQLNITAAFDGACSFNSFLYLDPIDLLNTVCSLHAALKPGGLLFLYGYDSGPSWRGEPFSHRVDQWMWSWHYGMEEVAGLLEEHGYFEVLETRVVQTDPEEEERVAAELEKQRQDEEEFNRRQSESEHPFPMPFLKIPVERSPYGYVVIARKCER